jgi:hypothetical protein
MDIDEAFGATASIDELLKGLEAQLPLLPEKDQEFILGSRMNVDSGFPLDEGSKKRLRQINTQLTQVSHNALDQPSLSPIDALRNLARIRQQLSASEQQFANALAVKLQRGETLPENELLRLFNMHKAKGF